MSLLAQTSTQQLVTSSITAVTAQFQTLSTQTFNVSSINGIVPGAAFSGSTVALSTGSVIANSLQAYSYINMTGGVLSNVASNFFTTPKYTTTFTPTSISGLRNWFDASQTTSILSNGSGQAYQWNNLAGYGNATQGTTSNMPITGAVTINGLNVLNFPVGGFMNIPAINYTTSNRSAFLVVQSRLVYGKNNNFVSGDSLNIMLNNNDYPIIQATGGTLNNLFVYPLPVPSIMSNTTNIITLWLDPNSFTSNNPFYINGSNWPNQNRYTGSLATGNLTHMLGSNITDGFYFCEYIYYDTNLTVSQRQTVEGYLAWKWGINGSLIATQPYYSTPPPPLGTVYLPAGSLGTDATSNLTLQATANTKISLAGNTQITGLLTTSSIGISSINNSTLTQLITQPFQSTFTGLTQSLGTAGYISTAQLTSTVRGIGSGFTGSTIGLSAATINTSTINSIYLSSVQGYVSSLRTDSLTVGGPTGYVTVQDLTTATISTGQLVAGAGFISSLQINTLSFGPTGYVIVGDVIANSLSTTRLNTQALYTNNAYIGNVSSQSAILFPGIDGNYRGTAIAERTTGVGTGELLLYKVSSTTDQIRLQTTGNLVFEVGAPSRSWNSTTQLATPSLYIQGSTSNVGVGTAAPATTFDVVGTGRFQVVSSFALNVSSINGAAPGGTFNGSTTALSTAIVTTSTLATNSAKTSSLTMYGTLNMSNNLLTNIYSALFAPTYSGNPNNAAGGIYTIYTSGSIDYAVHAFKTVGTTTFTANATITGAQILVIGGGGSGGGGAVGGGGGAGGLVYATGITITPATYSIVVGGGGVLTNNPNYNTPGVSGSNSSALGYTGNGGGAGGSDQNHIGANGGCGGGGCGLGAFAGGTGSQGFAGGTAVTGDGGAGGGGMGSIGSVNSGSVGGAGGSGLTYSITGTATGYAAGGGGGSTSGTTPVLGGSANGTVIGGYGGASTVPPTAGAANTGSGGGGQRSPSGFILPGAGGSGIVIIAYPLNQYTYTPYTIGTITGDATSNLSIQPVNNLNIVGITQTSALLVASTFSTTFINATTISTPALNVSTINGAAFTAATPFTGSTLSLSTASIFTSSLRASTISVGGGAWMSNDGLYLSNVQAGGAVGKLVTHSGYVKLMTATAWNGGYGALAITGGDLTPKVYMGMGTSIAGGNLAIGGLSPSPGAGITLDVFGAARFSSISTFQAVTSSIGVGMANPIFPLDVAGLGRFQILSTLALNVSSINGQSYAAPFQSTTEGLGTLGYISSTQLGSTVTNLITRIGAGGGGGTTFVGSTTFLSASQILFSTQTGYNISSVLGFVSSLQVDELQIGTGFGIIAFGDTNMSSISTLGIAAGLGNFTTINVSSINGAIPGTGSGGTTFTGTLGTVSSLTALRFFGLTGTYANTAVAEVSTGTGLQELLLYKVSSVSDQVRVQTTGNVIFETGVGARSWPTASRVLPPTLYIAGSNSNVGIGTSNPVTTLDVVGTGRFQTLSSLNITAGSINYSVAFV